MTIIGGMMGGVPIRDPQDRTETADSTQGRSTDATGAANGRPTESPTNGIRVEISPEAWRAYERRQSLQAATPEAHAARVQALKAHIANGTYVVDPHQTADAILQHVVAAHGQGQD